MFERVLVPLDGSQLAEQVLPHVEVLAKAFGSTIMLIRAVMPVEGSVAAGTGPGVVGMPMETGIDPVALVEEKRRQAEAYLRDSPMGQLTKLLGEEERREAEVYLAARTDDLASRLGVGPAQSAGTAGGATRLPSVRYSHPPGDAAEVIVERARTANADLIAMTTHGRSGLSRLVYGSVAETVLRTASCPILLVRVRG